jgi:glycosyltransferase involved in cell wall biosynthesis
MIAYMMHKVYGLDASVVCYKLGEYPYSEQYTKGLNLDFVPRTHSIIVDSVRYLIKNAKKIDFLHLFHFRIKSLISILIYKLLNPKGKVYLKLDANSGIKKIKYRKYHAFDLIKFSILKCCDLISVETSNLQSYLNEHWPVDIHLIPNGFSLNGIEINPQNLQIKIDNDCVNKYIYSEIEKWQSKNGVDFQLDVRHYYEKKNILLSVGRIGVYEKNSEMLLNAVAQLDLKDWIVILAGPVDESFHGFIDHYFKIHPDLVNRVIFTGNIADRQILFALYNISKVLCLTSRWEGFPLVFPEALFFGNYIVTTEVGAEIDITRNGRIGSIIPQNDEKSLTNKLQQIIDQSLDLSKKFDEIIEHGQKNYSWDIIVDDVYRLLMDH